MSSDRSTGGDAATVPGKHFARRGTVEITAGTRLLGFNLGEVWQFRGLLFFLVLRDLRVRYKQAALGVIWVLLQPAVTVIIFSIVFGLFARFPSEGVPYPVYTFAALLPWLFFAEAVRRSTVSLVGDSELIRKVYFPRLIVPVVTVLTPVVDFLVAFVVLLGVMLFYGIVPTPRAFLAPVLLLQPLLLAFAIGLWLAPINVRYRDVSQIVPFLLQIGMYASPIVYPLSMVPERWQGIYSLNPMVGVIESFRWCLFGTGSTHAGAIAVSATFTLLLLAGGLVFFRKMERSFADII